jgi:hypothetical protein
MSQKEYKLEDIYKQKELDSFCSDNIIQNEPSINEEVLDKIYYSIRNSLLTNKIDSENPKIEDIYKKNHEFEDFDHSDSFTDTEKKISIKQQLLPNTKSKSKTCWQFFFG